jgi:hypothetical protein
LYLVPLKPKSEGKIPLGRSWPRWEFDIKMNSENIEWYGINWIHLAQGVYQWRDVVDQIRGLRFPKRKKMYGTT